MLFQAFISSFFAEVVTHFSEDKQSIVFDEVTQQQSGSYYCLALEPREYLFESSDSVEVNLKLFLS